MCKWTLVLILPRLTTNIISLAGRTVSSHYEVKLK
jgi:hypothetical protein